MRLRAIRRLPAVIRAVGSQDHRKKRQDNLGAVIIHLHNIGKRLFEFFKLCRIERSVNASRTKFLQVILRDPGKLL